MIKDFYDPCGMRPRNEVYKKYYGGVWFKPKIMFKGFTDENKEYFKKNKNINDRYK